MKKRKSQRIKFVIVGLFLLGFSTLLIGFGLRESIQFFYTPSQLAEMNYNVNENFRVGGLVKANSIKKGKGKKIEFVLEDQNNQIKIFYEGILPDLFKEKMGIIASGFLNSEKDLKTGYTLTNARNIFFSNKFIGYRYPAYSKSILRKNYKNDIKNGIFFGINNLSDFKKKISISLDCVSSYNFQDIPVAKRNFFGTKEFEKVLKVKFKNNLIQCL